MAGYHPQARYTKPPRPQSPQDWGRTFLTASPSATATIFRPSIFVPIRYASRKTKTANMLEACGRAVPAPSDTSHSTCASIAEGHHRRRVAIVRRSPPAVARIASSPRHGASHQRWMSASLIGPSGSSTFRLSTTAMSMSLAGSCFSSESALGPLYGAFLSRRFGRAPFFSSPVSLFDLKAVSSSRSALRSSWRAQELSRLAVAPTLRHTPPFPGPHLDSFEHDGTAWCGSDDDDQRGARLRARINRATTLYSVGPRTRTMMQSCASAAKLRSGGPILPFGIKAKGPLGIPPPRTVIGVPSQAYGQGRNCRGTFSVLRSLCRTQNDAVRDNALPHEPPQGNQ